MDSLFWKLIKEKVNYLSTFPNQIWLQERQVDDKAAVFYF